MSPDVEQQGVTIDSKVSTSNRNQSIDLFRLMGAFAVILLHVNYFELNNFIVLGFRWTGRWAVPFFFIVSGYFFFKNYKLKGDLAFNKSIENLVAIFFISNIIFTLYNLSQNHWIIAKAATVDIFGWNGHLWFINSLIIGLIGLWFIIKRNEKLALPVSVLLLCFYLITKPYSTFLNVETDPEFASLLLSIPFLTIGYKLSKNERTLSYFSIKFTLALIIGGFILQTVEILALYKWRMVSPHNHELLVGTIFFATGVFLLATKINIKRLSILSEYGRKYSLPMYIYHPLILVFVSSLVQSASTTLRPALLWANPILCIFFTFILFWLLDKKCNTLYLILTGQPIKAVQKMYKV